MRKKGIIVILGAGQMLNVFLGLKSIFKWLSWIIIAIILFVIVFNFVSCSSFQKSSIEDQTDTIASSSALYVACLRGATAKERVGQNIQDCQPFIQDSTYSGKLDNFERCLKINNDSSRKEEDKLNCKQIFFPENNKNKKWKPKKK